MTGIGHTITRAAHVFPLVVRTGWRSTHLTDAQQANSALGAGTAGRHIEQKKAATGGLAAEDVVPLHGGRGMCAGRYIKFSLCCRRRILRRPKNGRLAKPAARPAANPVGLVLLSSNAGPFPAAEPIVPAAGFFFYPNKSFRHRLTPWLPVTLL